MPEGVFAHPALPPVRGIVPVHNWRHRPFRVTDIHRCLNYLLTAYQVKQADVLCHGTTSTGALQMVEYCAFKGVPWGYRTDCTSSPREIRVLAERGLESLMLTPQAIDDEGFEAWLATAAELKLPIRLQLTGAFTSSQPVSTLAKRWKDLGVRVVTFKAADPFIRVSPRPKEDQEASLAFYNDLAAALQQEALALSFCGFPLQVLHPDNRPLADGLDEYFRNHEHYQRAPYTFASFLYRYPPKVVRLLMLYQMARLSHQEDTVDRYLMRLVVLHGRYLYKPVHLVSKLYRAVLPRPHYRNYRDLEEHDWESGMAQDFAAAFPDVPCAAMLFSGPQRGDRRYYFDPVNRECLEERKQQEALAKHALEWQRNEKPLMESHDQWGPLNSAQATLLGAQKWFSASAEEKISSPLCWVETPFMIMITFGGGMAELVGFRINRTQAILCPMIAPSHTLLLYVDRDGRFVLLRDGELVEPSWVEGRTVVPLRMTNSGPIHLSVWNINDALSLTPLKVWSRAPLYQERKEGIKYSIVLFCTYFARRLEACLRCIAHQTGVAMDMLEVIVAYVPGIDATEDVIDSMRDVFPELRILHAAMTRGNVKTKGYAINEALKLASGDWIMLMDADILLPPDMFSTLEPLTEQHGYLAPIGRAMLDRKTTSKILLGEIEPWNAWQSLLDGAEQIRDREARGVPIGFNQIFRRSFLEKVQYKEYQHFEGADWEFGVELRAHFGLEHRFDVRVLHLDHGGSQWYGVQRHF